MLITHATDDRVVKPAVVDEHSALISHAQVHWMADAGHGCFRNDAPRFNQRLREFAAML